MSYTKGKIVALVHAEINFSRREYLVSYKVGQSNLTLLNEVKEPEIKEEERWLAVKIMTEEKKLFAKKSYCKF